MKRLLQKVHPPEEPLDFLLRSVPGALIISKDIALKKVLHNDNAAMFLRIQPWETLSYTTIPPFKIFRKGIEIKTHLLPMQRAIEFGEIIVQEEFEFVWPDGVLKTALFNAKPLEDEEGRIVGAIATLEDITRLKQVENSLREAKEEAERLADFDHLTDILNRRAFMKRLDEEIKRAKRQKTTTGLILMDIDLFKEVNDTHGHLVGDFVLQKFCDCIKQSLRSYDFFGRYGGEEFVVCLPYTNLSLTAIVAERMRQEVEQLEIIKNSLHISVTASFGVAHLNYSSEENMDSFISRADDAMYYAKSERNLVRYV